MNIPSILRIPSIILVISLVSLNTFAIDIVKIRKQKIFDNKEAHNSEVIRRALEVTQDKFGPFTFEEVFLSMNANRMLKTVEEGDIINIALMPANEKWDKTNIPIRIPVRLGLLNYRLLVINKAAKSKFEEINTLEELNSLSAGLLRNWVTTKIYKANDLNVIEVINLESLFLMLNKQRIDYLPRTVYEIYEDLKAQTLDLQSLIVEPKIVLHIPMYTFVYVSPTTPRLVKRLESGLQTLLKNGELKDILYKYYGADIERANLPQRKIIYINNPTYDFKMNLNDDELFKIHN